MSPTTKVLPDINEKTLLEIRCFGDIFFLSKIHYKLLYVNIPLSNDMTMNTGPVRVNKYNISHYYHIVSKPVLESFHSTTWSLGRCRQQRHEPQANQQVEAGLPIRQESGLATCNLVLRAVRLPETPSVSWNVL